MSANAVNNNPVSLSVLAQGGPENAGQDESMTAAAAPDALVSWSALANKAYEVEKVKDERRFCERTIVVFQTCGIPAGVVKIIGSYWSDSIFTPDTPLGEICGKNWIHLEEQEAVKALREKLKQYARFMRPTIDAMPRRLCAPELEKNPNPVPTLWVLKELAVVASRRLSSVHQEVEALVLHPSRTQEIILAAVSDLLTFSDLEAGTVGDYAEPYNAIRWQKISVLKQKYDHAFFVKLLQEKLVLFP